ncbi:MAG: glycerophosphodiester phosphodiesterase [Gammaproteobacteria bacterium]|nr:glycerophosphodiester phosphodiesterase [Gammaproteobacteria bacterium]
MKKYLLLALFFFCIDTQGAELIAHRGIAPGFKENTLAAIKESWMLGADAVEIDLRISSDGVVYLFHDDEIDAGYVRDFEYLQLNAILTDIEIPTLSSVLNLGTPSGFYILDLKDHDERMKNALIAVVAQTSFPATKLVVQSHDIDLLVSIRETLPDAKYSFLTSLKREMSLLNSANPTDIASTLKQYDIDHIAAKGRSFIDRLFVDEFRNRGICFYVWTINDSSRVDYYSQIGVDGVITDILATLKE